jgi:hypothetical protein
MKEYMHYQEYFKNFLGAWSFPNGDETLTIKQVAEEQMFDAQTGEKKEGLCIRFYEKELPMVLNVTNAAAIAEMTGTDVIREWIGKQVIVGTSKVKAFGKTTEAIRVRLDKPVPAKKKNSKATSAQLAQIEELIASGAISNREAMLDFFGVKSVDELTEQDAASLIKAKGGK